MADETRKKEGSQGPELDDQVLEDVTGGAGGVQNPDDTNYNIRGGNNVLPPPGSGGSTSS